MNVSDPRRQPISNQLICRLLNYYTLEKGVCLSGDALESCEKIRQPIDASMHNDDTDIGFLRFIARRCCTTYRMVFKRALHQALPEPRKILGSVQVGSPSPGASISFAIRCCVQLLVSIT